MPSFFFTSGRKFSTTTSALAARRLNTASPRSSFRFSVMARLLRCKFWKSDPRRGPPGCSPPESSVSASILTTLAPQSASCRTQVGPDRTRVRSSTVKRDRASEACGKGIVKGSGSDCGVTIVPKHHAASLRVRGCRLSKCSAWCCLLRCRKGSARQALQLVACLRGERVIAVARNEELERLPGSLLTCGLVFPGDRRRRVPGHRHG